MKKTQIGASGCFNAIILAIGAFVVLVGLSHLGEKEKEEQRAKERQAQYEQQLAKQKNIKAEFDMRRNEIIADIQDLIAEQQYLKAQQKAKYYSISNDKEIAELENLAEEKSIVSNLKSVPASNTQLNYDLYSRLVHLAPNNKAYQAKKKHYGDILAARKKQQDQRLAKFGPYPEKMSSGFYKEVGAYLYLAAHDPSSIDYVGCTETYHINSGWLVGCVYRGKNAFGAMVKNAKWFIISHGRVVEVKDSDAYSWD